MIEKTIFDYIPAIYRERQEYKAACSKYPKWLIKGVMSYVMRVLSVTIVAGKNNKLILPGLFFLPGAISWIKYRKDMPHGKKRNK